MPAPLLVAKSHTEHALLPALANRHGLIAGATGTGKTVTLQRLAEGFSRIGTVSTAERAETLKASGLGGVYDKADDRESAYEKLAQKVTERGAGAPAPAAGDQAQGSGGLFGALGDLLGGSTGPRGGRREGAIEAATKSAARAIGSQLGRQIFRGVLGGLLGTTTTRRR